MPLPSPEGAIRWTVNRAAGEFGTTHQTLTRRLLALGVVPAEDGFYSTKQIASAVFGDKDGERIRLLKEQADKIELENAQTRREQAPMVQVEKVWVGWALAIRDAVRDQEIPHEMKQAILTAVRDVDPEEYFKEEDPDAAETE